MTSKGLFFDSEEKFIKSWNHTLGVKVHKFQVFGAFFEGLQVWIGYVNIEQTVCAFSKRLSVKVQALFNVFLVVQGQNAH